MTIPTKVEINKEQILERFKEDLWQSSPHTISSRTFYAQKWLDFAGPPEQWDKSLVVRFMKSLEAEGYSKGTERFIYQIVSRVFAVARVDWPMGKRGAPKVQPSDVVKPASELEHIKAMVDTAKQGKLDSDETAFLALSTTYGLRREELLRISPGDVDYKKGTIYVRTCKGGIERDQLLAAEIIPFVEKCDFTMGYSLFDLSRMYHTIEKKAGVPHTDGGGWHSPRRTLDTILVQWNYIYTKIFLRWKLSADMALAYITLDPLKVDQEVFNHHPFLGFW